MKEEKRDDSISKAAEILSRFPGLDLKILQVISAKPFCTVLVAENNRLGGRAESIKIQESVEEHTIMQVEQEAKILGSIKHPNIPRIYDISSKDDVLLIRSEFVEGYSLRQVIEAFARKGRKFPQAAATEITLKLMKGLHHAHNNVSYFGKKKSIIHSDIKPENIILSAKEHDLLAEPDDAFLDLVEENRAEPYLIDFGVASFTGEDGQLKGTLAYLSPLQAKGDSKLSWRTDMHQLLYVYHEMLTLKRPFDAMLRKKIIEEKAGKDFKAGIGIPIQIRRYIERGLKRDVAESFGSEEEYIRSVSAILRGQKREIFIRKHRKLMISVAAIAILVLLSFASFAVWDDKTQSTDAIVKRIENNPDIFADELSLELSRLQKRAFEKKYYEPLLRGDFRDKKTGEGLYPSHLDANGNWVLVGPNTEAAGAFAGMLFEHSDRYPDLLAIAIEYAEPILASEFDGMHPRRFQYALIPAYEATGDERYLEKLEKVAGEIGNMIGMRKNMTHTADLYYGEMYVWLYDKTGNQDYLNLYIHTMETFIDLNIDADGYVFEHARKSASMPMGPIPDGKGSRLLVVYNSFSIGSYIEMKETENVDFKEITSIWSRDYLELMKELNLLYVATDDEVYLDYYNSLNAYYLNHLPDDEMDILFVAGYDRSQAIYPKDTYATLKAIELDQRFDPEEYHSRIRALLSPTNFRNEDDNGILRNSVLILDNIYEHNNEEIKDQTLIFSDRLFLKI